MKNIDVEDCERTISYELNRGWICPRCGRANAPWVSHCDCIATETGTTNFGCIHEWECVGVDTEGFTLQCKKCGMTKRDPISY